MGTWKFAVIGGDLRQARLAQCLLRDGHSVCLWGIDPQDLPDGVTPCADLGHALEDADCVILPLPAATADGLISTPLSGSRLMPGELFARIPRGALCFGGRISPSLWAAAREAGIDMDEDTLIVRAEAHAIRNGGRNPRTAKQFVDLLQAGVL